MQKTLDGYLPLLKLRLLLSSLKQKSTHNLSAIYFYRHLFFYLSPYQSTLSPSNAIPPKGDQTHPSHHSISKVHSSTHYFEHLHDFSTTFSGTYSVDNILNLTDRQSLIKPHMTAKHLLTSSYKVKDLESSKFHLNYEP